MSEKETEFVPQSLNGSLLSTLWSLLKDHLFKEDSLINPFEESHQNHVALHPSILLLLNFARLHLKYICLAV
jgi:hypothetical protein